MEVELKENENLNKYIKELNSDFELNIHNIREKSLMVSTIRSKWLSYLFAEKETLDRLKTAKSKILSSKLNDKNSQGSVLRLKNETAIAENDEKIQKLNILIKKTESQIDYIERAMNILNDLPWNIKNCIEILKLEKL